jgi:hypothetical protein
MRKYFLTRYFKGFTLALPQKPAFIRQMANFSGGTPIFLQIFH